MVRRKGDRKKWEQDERRRPEREEWRAWSGKARERVVNVGREGEKERGRGK